MRIRDWISDVCSSDLVKGVQPVGGMRGKVDERRQKTRQRLARAGGGDQQRMLVPLARLEHIGLMPPQPPPARGEPVGEGGGEPHAEDVARRGPRGKAFSPPPGGRGTIGSPPI